MSKPLSEMTLEELWQLFPIVLTPHNQGWAQVYEREAQRLRTLLPEWVRLEHIGSTAVEGIWAKPIIDILALLPGTQAMGAVRDILCANGYILMSAGDGRMSFNRGYTEHGFAQEVFHLHLRREGDDDEIYFRDYLRTHPDTAEQYERLKLSLWHEYEHDRDGYTAAKSEFVARVMALAR